jgi:adenosine deaminase
MQRERLSVNITPSSPTMDERYQAMPKVELHRHLEGSLRLQTLIEVARAHGIDIIGTGQLRSLVQINQGEPYTFQNFLSKFQTLRLFYRSPEVIGRITREAVADAGADNVCYMELRFTPVALSRAQGFTLAEVMDWVIEGAREADSEYGTTTKLIASVNRHEPVELAEQVAQLAVDRVDKGVVGLDLAGNEAQFSAVPFAEVFLGAQQEGLHLTVHAGEWGGADNVAEAIRELNADRIGHGVRVMEDPSVVDLARDRGVTFEVCITSNYQSGVVSSLEQHPITKMIQSGLNVTINTDDPRVSQITLSDEYRLACEEIGIPLDALQERIIAAAEASFLPENDRQRLVQSLEDQFIEPTV